MFDQKLYKVNYLLRVVITFALPKPGVRCAGQDDDPHSGSREALARVKPDKRPPVLWDERKLPERLPGADKCKQGAVSFTY
jgi:hypothetical protein